MKLLIAEDEKGIADFLKQGLEEEGYEVLIAQNGLDACKMAAEDNPDLILLDWMMPKMTGLDACRAIRENDHTTPVIFVTAKDTVQEAIEGLKAGANDYIKKPFSFEELLQRINIHFRYKDDAKELLIGDVKVVLPRHQVFKGGKEIILTQKEYDLLVYLIKNKGTVCSRQQIIKDVWDIHFDYDTGVIDVFINAIRKKLGLNRENDFIRAVRGVGYIADGV